MKFWNKWLRKIHRWIVIPFVIVFLLLVFGRQMPWANVLQRAQQIMLLFFILTGSYLYLLPYLAKGQRQRKRKSSEAQQAKRQAAGGAQD